VGYYHLGSSGYHGFLKDGATFMPIDVPGADMTIALGINDLGQIVGFYRDSTGYHGFLKDGTTFTRLDVPGSSYTYPYGINTNGQVVGSYLDTTGSRGFLVGSEGYHHHRARDVH